MNPGEDFNEQISGTLSKADFVLFAVTPDFLEPGNYVLEKEYVQAAAERKRMVAVVMQDVDIESFRKAYPDLQLIPFEDHDRLAAVLADIQRGRRRRLCLHPADAVRARDGI